MIKNLNQVAADKPESTCIASALEAVAEYGGVSSHQNTSTGSQLLAHSPSSNCVYISHCRQGWGLTVCRTTFNVSAT